MADETDLSRSEPASPQRLQQAREAGDVPRSAELSAWLVLLAALGSLGWTAPQLLGALEDLTALALTHAAEPVSPDFIRAVEDALWAVLPVLAATFLAALAAPVLLSGWVFAPQVSQARFGRANPLKSFGRVFSAEFWFDGGVALFKIVLVVLAASWALTRGWPGLAQLSDSAATAALSQLAAWLAQGVLALAAMLAVVAAADAGWRWWRYLRRHAMTWQEVLAEAREAEGNPEMRAQMQGRPRPTGQHVDEVLG